MDKALSQFLYNIRATFGPTFLRFLITKALQGTKALKPVTISEAVAILLSTVPKKEWPVMFARFGWQTAAMDYSSKNEIVSARRFSEISEEWYEIATSSIRDQRVTGGESSEFLRKYPLQKIK